jgi:hypothetical protein
LLIVKPRYIESGDGGASPLIFTSHSSPFLHHTDVTISSMQETASHRDIRFRATKGDICDMEYFARPDVLLTCQPCDVPPFLYDTCPRVATPGRQPYAYDRTMAYRVVDHNANCDFVTFGSDELAELEAKKRTLFFPIEEGGLRKARPQLGWSNIVIPGW